MLGIIGGTAILKAKLPPLAQRTIATPFGSAEVYASDRLVVLKRHQHDIPPGEINHRAHLAALKIAGVDRLILICSTGGMKENYAPGSIVLPSDFFSPWDIPTLHDHDICHVAPAIDPAFRKELLDLIPDAMDGVYIQTRGPRFETKAEIAHFAASSDVVGMTAASEITLANELGIPVAAICMVDNFANGIGTAEKLSYDDLIDAAAKNSIRMTELIGKISEKFA
ncbi:MAG TPA: MTAP family purine nucleoside phosphorylase [Methanocorpusculum sp.]|nr:MTAP family purine nucleoside phosphorylase [Methanocorpusculum sp.]